MAFKLHGCIVSPIIMSFCSQFIDDRLKILDQGKEPDDVFEEEVLQCGASSGACLHSSQNQTCLLGCSF